MKFDQIGLMVPDILLPAEQVDMQRWAVIACDQYTSERAYWQRLAQQVGEAPSTLKLILPEVYLEDADVEQRIRAINQTMADYLVQGLFKKLSETMILVDRRTVQVPSRKGLMVALDLERYDYRPGSQSLIRATEGTIVERLPPRIRVRENAPIELPHIMVLIDDPQRTVIEPLFEAKLEKAYDFELLNNGGHLRGYRVDQPQLIEQVVRALEHLAAPEVYRDRYNVEGEVMLYAMGDGNHSFATAKAIWERIKEQADDPRQVMDHPARFALVELVNVHDPGLEFEAIHRVLFEVDAALLQRELNEYFAARKTPLTLSPCADFKSAQESAQKAEGAHAFVMVLPGACFACEVADPEYTLEVATLQAFLDDFLRRHPEVRIDYIHGEREVTDLGGQKNNAGFYLPAISKHDFFRTIVIDGALPRKTFSMGEADEKRFYLECRKISA
ncbi:Protein of unknown function [Geoalkalibacter ferrihydriticus]|uniref:DUF1015 domain-containing protein n=2 Tax=Geoalkalibacter ferrihydriticus TaxID=392333 RepID=A0A0C2EBQ2_9BACT|nr:DUF1015 domain-containing protein [Geoalkalibacter ferrihydriticus]KIH75998.1 hypothetical protein GFER_13965 [Geoalkalibacter ferrihydriticus DSM 17813]SDM59361.1 Protein of unknown function [Geoalkalibacter ferrihydriticus]